MSTPVDVLDVLEGIITSVLPEVLVERQASMQEILPPTQFPVIVLLFTDLDPEQLDHQQIRRRWEFTGIYYRKDSPPNRDRITNDLQDLTDALSGDQTLGQTVYLSFVEGGVPVTHPDAAISVGAFVVRTEKVF